MSQQHLVDRRDVAQKLWRGGMCQTSWICRAFGVDRSTFWRWMNVAREFEREFGVAISQQTVSRILGEQGIVRKKLKFVSPEAMAQPERHVTFHERIAGVEPENLAALDESSFHINEGPRTATLAGARKPSSTGAATAAPSSPWLSACPWCPGRATTAAASCRMRSMRAT
ncbi:hypothetical protein DFJ74DRAFT_300050 [Hyaloraphidium curvatum]|nr:hypothetical protein DFJ74DRAFT_300050 [Hyaloraphidium curvatum]